MDGVAARFVGGPADGEIHRLPREFGHAAPANWAVRKDTDVSKTGLAIEHLYEREPHPDPDGTWTMNFVRTQPVGMIE